LAHILWVRADGRELGYGERVVLGVQGIQQITVGLSFGEARMRVERHPDGRYDYAEVAG
jgi:hypothetical protein